MAIVYRTSLFFQLTTAPQDPRYGIERTGGWTEGFWAQTDVTLTALANFTAFMQARALLMSSSGQITSWRVQKYDMQNNNLSPQGSRIAPVSFPGRGQVVTDLPQAALQLTVTTTGTPNKATHLLRGIPDVYISGGEFFPDPAYLGFLTQYRNLLVGSQYGFVGRDLGQASARVLSASPTDGVLVDAIPGTGLVAGNWVRFNRSFSSTSVPITRTYQVQSVAGNVIRLVGWEHIITKPSGTLRRDQLGFFQFETAFIRRATVKKVGAPFEKFRGRRSKRRK